MHGARAVGRGLVPDRRQPQHGPGIAGAQRADDEVVHRVGVLDGDHVLALPAREAELGNGRGGVLEEPCLVVGIAPGLGDDPGAVVRADLGFVGLDQHIERLRVHVAFLDQDRFERAHAQVHLREMRAVLVIVVVIMIVIAVHAPSPFQPVSAAVAKAATATSASAPPATRIAFASRMEFRATTVRSTSALPTATQLWITPKPTM